MDDNSNNAGVSKNNDLIKDNGETFEMDDNSKITKNTQPKNRVTVTAKSDEQKCSGDFDIEVTELEKIMGYYKERGSNFKDLEYFQKQKGIDKLLQALKCDTENGLADLTGREEYFGSNKVFVEPVPHFCVYVWEALEDMMVRILIVAAIVQIVLGCTLSDDPSRDWVDGVSIVVAVLVVVLVGSITNYQKEQKFHELNEVQQESTKFVLIRNGQPVESLSDDILVGDLIMINYGDIMPADLLLIEGNGVKMDESALTGESDAMKKETYHKCMKIKKKNKESTKLPSPLILSGTNCIEGSGKAIVLAVGDHSQKGIIRRTVDNAQENAKTPLEEKLEDIAEMIGYFGLAAGVVTLVALFIRFAISFSDELDDYGKDSKIESIMTSFYLNLPSSSNNPEISGHVNNTLTDPKDMVAKKILDIVILCISIIVVAIPEGLPLAVTLSLAFSIKKLMDFNNLVRKMHACETMGGANYICTDKTGTLTKNEMNVFTILTGRTKIELKQNIEVKDVGEVANKKGADADGSIVRQIREDHAKRFKNETFWEVLKVAIAMNVECTIKKIDEPDINGDTEYANTKNKTDKAFIDFLYRFKSPISVEREKYLKDEGCFKQFPFDSQRKRMTTFIRNESFPTGYRLFSKGGGENAINFCKYYIDPQTGSKLPLTDDNLSFIKETIENFNKNKLRSLYVAYKDINQNEYDNCEHKNRHGKLVDQYDLIFIGVFGIKDSLRDGVKEAVTKCHEASVKVIMVTGDNIVTATAIAKDCGILGDDVNLKNLQAKDIEEDPEQMNDENKKDRYIKLLLKNQPRAMTGNSFYNAIGGLICEICGKSSDKCECPKTEAEAKQIAEKTGTEMKPVKKDVIKDIEKFKKLTERLLVMARSQPIHKYALVVGLKSLSNVVAVTGDGTNDAPALSKSDVGFAMFSGTDIAKEASEIIIIDNNFSSIVVAIIYGRNIYDNIRKFLQFQLTVNFCACILVFLCACIGNESPLSAIQMLWVNLIMDSLGSLALATEPPYNELLKREPTKRNESIINGRMWKHIIIQSVVQLILLLVLYLIAPEFIKEDSIKRLSENNLINICYGQMPGEGKPDHIIYGTESSWKSSVKLNIEIEHMDCGNYGDRQSLSVAYKAYTNATGNTTHMSIIFNVFVFYTLFNQINCRVLDDSLNIFVRISKSILFPIITLCEMGLQVVLICFGNEAFGVVENGLTLIQWLICLGFSAITFVVSIIIKLIPLEKLIDALIAKFAKASEEDDGSDKNGDEVKMKKETQKNTEDGLISNEARGLKEDKKERDEKEEKLEKGERMRIKENREERKKKHRRSQDNGKNNNQ